MMQLREARLPLGFDRGARQELDIFREYGRLKKLDPQREMRKFLRRRYVTTFNNAYGSYTAMTVTNLQSLLSDATDPYGAWQSARVDNQTSVKALDYEIAVYLTTTADAPANDAAAYVYIIPWMTTDGGTTWIAGGNFGTVTLPTGSEGTASISDPNSMRSISLPYKITSQPMQTLFSLKQFLGCCPDGWSLAIRTNNCAAGAGNGLDTGCVVAYRAITITGT